MDLKDKLLSIKKTYYQKKLFLLKYIFSIVVLVLAVSNTKNIGYSFLSFLNCTPKVRQKNLTFGVFLL